MKKIRFPVRNYIYNPKDLTKEDVDKLCRRRNEESFLDNTPNSKYHRNYIDENIALNG